MPVIVLATLLVIATAVAAVVTALRLDAAQRDGEPAPAPAPVPSATPAPAAARTTRPPANPVERLIVTLRRRKGARVALSALSLVLLAGAGGLIAYPFYTNLQTTRLQSRLDRQLASPELRQAYVEGRVGEGDSLTRIIIPKLDVDVVVVEGTSASALRAGAGHYPSTPLPCQLGNVAIAGHRTTYGRPFHNLDLLEPGDLIILETPLEQCTYEMTEAPYIVAPTDVDVVANTPDDARLTLTTCHPKGSARERLIVHASMVRTETFAS